MNGSYIKEIRAKGGLKQKDLAKILGCTQAHISNMENGIIEIPQAIISTLNKLVDKETGTTLTDKKFSRALFLKHMLTGNEIVDSIYKEAQWLKDLDRAPVYAKGVRIILKTDDKTIHKYYKRIKGHKVRSSTPPVREWEKQYIILKEGLPFYCREEWLK